MANFEFDTHVANRRPDGSPTLENAGELFGSPTVVDLSTEVEMQGLSTLPYLFISIVSSSIPRRFYHSNYVFHQAYIIYYFHLKTRRHRGTFTD